MFSGSECLNGDRVNGLTPQKVEDKDSLILCKDGHCKSVTPEEFLVSAFPRPEMTVPEPSEAWMENTRKWLEKTDPNKAEEKENEKEKEEKKEKKEKKKKKKQQKSKKKKVEVVRPKPGEDTVLLDHQQMKHAQLPIGAVEIGTIAETESYDEEDDETTEGIYLYTNL